MKIATWNINGIKARLPVLLNWLKEANPDVCCLQEIKSVDENFPGEAIEDLGYNVITHGQKGFNGVAILSKRPVDDVTIGLPGDDDDIQARYLEAVIPYGDQIVRVASIYLPNGNPVDTEKYPYKLGWMDRLTRHAQKLLLLEEPLILAGDYNVIPQREDARKPDSWVDDALFKLESREKFRQLVNLGFTDALRVFEAGDDVYTFWDYQAGAWQRNNGIRIDHMLLSPQASDVLVNCHVDKYVRDWERPSDHVPVVLEIG